MLKWFVVCAAPRCIMMNKSPWTLMVLGTVEHIKKKKYVFSPLLDILSSILTGFNILQASKLTPLVLPVHCISQARRQTQPEVCGSEPVLIRYRSLKCWAVSRTRVRQFVLLTTQWTCFIGTSLEVSGKWRPELWGSGLLPSFSWRVNYTVGGAGGAEPRLGGWDCGPAAC